MYFSKLLSVTNEEKIINTVNNFRYDRKVRNVAIIRKLVIIQGSFLEDGDITDSLR